MLAENERFELYDDFLNDMGLVAKFEAFLKVKGYKLSEVMDNADDEEDEDFNEDLD